MIPRRFYVLSVFCGFALLSVYVFLSRTDGALSVHLPDNWKSTFEQGNGKPAKEESLPYNGSPVAHQTPPLGIATSMQARPSTFPPPVDTPLLETLNVAVVDSGGSNEETTAALIHSFGVQKGAQLSLYTLQQRYGIGEVINAFNFSSQIAANKSSSEFTQAIENGKSPNILISATCESDLVVLDSAFTKLLNDKKTYLFCVIHQPERWSETGLTDKIRPWLDQQMADLVTFSPHTAHYLRTETISNWDFNATVTVHYLPPLFPVDIANQTEEPGKKEESKQYPITIYGDFDATRHDYTDAYSNLQKVMMAGENYTNVVKNETEVREVSLHILGERLPPAVPESIRDFLSVDHEMSYRQAYEILARSYVLLPAFAKNSDYLTKLASWAIPAALIAGIPFAADDDILNAYTYVPRDAVWFRYIHENEMGVAARVILWSEAEHIKKKQIVRERCARLIERNLELVAEWMELATRRVERGNWRMGAGQIKAVSEAT